MTFNPLLCSDKDLTLEVSIVQNPKSRYGGLLLIDNHWYRAHCKALRKATLDVVLIREGDNILKSILYRQESDLFSQL